MGEFISTLLVTIVGQVSASYLFDWLRQRKSRKNKKNLDKDKPDNSDLPGDNNR